MTEPSLPSAASRLDRLRDWLREGAGRRTAGLLAALALELLLIGLLLTLGLSGSEPHPAGPAVTTFDATPESEEDSPQDEQQEKKAEPQKVQPATPQTRPQPVTPDAPQSAPAPAVPAFIKIAPSDLASADISQLGKPQQPAQGPPAPAYGPPDTGAGTSVDTPRVGTAPNGEPLYAARWYREPTHGELAGYLSTASPGWGLIACKTAPNYRVEDCVPLQEYPSGSNLNRAILAAAWQFKVRPPRLGGKDMIGEWVRIRIDYTVNRVRAGS